MTSGWFHKDFSLLGQSPFKIAVYFLEAPDMGYTLQGVTYFVLSISTYAWTKYVLFLCLLVLQWFVEFYLV